MKPSLKQLNCSTVSKKSPASLRVHQVNQHRRSPEESCWNEPQLIQQHRRASANDLETVWCLFNLAVEHGHEANVLLVHFFLLCLKSCRFHWIWVVQFFNNWRERGENQGQLLPVLIQSMWLNFTLKMANHQFSWRINWRQNSVAVNWLLCIVISWLAVDCNSASCCGDVTGHSSFGAQLVDSGIVLVKLNVGSFSIHRCSRCEGEVKTCEATTSEFGNGETKCWPSTCYIFLFVTRCVG